MPVSSRSATVTARETSRVNRYDTRPNSVSLASATPSSSPANVNTGATGPKISSRNIRASRGTPESTVGS